MPEVDETRTVAPSAYIQSLQLAIEALRQLDNQPELALLLSVEACRIDNNYETQSALLTALQKRPAFIARLHGPRSEVNQVAYSPDGTMVAAACGSRYNADGNVIYVWDVSTGRLLATLQGHHSPVLTVAFSPNGTLLASGAGDGALLLWDVAAGRQSATLTEYGMQIRSLAFSPDGVLLAAGGCGGVDFDMGGCNQGGLKLWNVQTHQPHGELLTGHTNAITSLTFSPDGNSLASGTGGPRSFALSADTVILWNLAERTQITLPFPRYGTPGVDRSICCLAFHPNGKYLVAATTDEPMLLWDVECHGLLPIPPRYPRTHDACLALQFSADGSRLLSADVANRVTAVECQTYTDPRTNAEEIDFQGQKSYGEHQSVQSVAFSPDGKRWVAGGGGKKSPSGIYIEGEVGIWSSEEQYCIATPISGQFWWANTVAFSPDGKLLAASVGDGPESNNEIHFWDLQANQWVGKCIPSGRARPLVFSPDGKWLASGEGNTIRVLDTVHYEPVVPPLEVEVSVLDFAFTPVGTLFAIAGNGEIVVRDLHGQRSLSLPLARPDDHVRCLTFSPDGQLLVGGSCNRVGEQRGEHEWRRDGCLEGAITFWDVEAGMISGSPLAAHTSAVIALAFSPDGKILATASDNFDGTILLWDIATRKQIGHPLVGHNGSVTKLCFRPDGRTLVSIAEHHGNEPGSLILWDVATQRPIGRPLATSPLGKDMTLSADGERLATCGINGSIFLWDLDPADWIARAGRLANRNLTQSEWGNYFGETPYGPTFRSFAED